MIPQIVNQITQALKYNWCAEGRSKFHGLAEILEKDGNPYPAEVCNGQAALIFPDSAIQFRVFYIQDEPIPFRESAKRTYGEQSAQDFTAPISLYVVGNRRALDEQCGGTVNEFAMRLFDALPREKFDASTAVVSLRIISSRVNPQSGDIIRQLYGNQVDRQFAELFAVEIQFEVQGTLCGGTCGEPVPLCPDVTVTDTDSMVYEVAPGDSFTCSATMAAIETITITFPAGEVNYEIPRMGFDGSLDTSEFVTSNVNSFRPRLNGSIVSGVVDFSAGDLFTVGIAQVDSGQPSTLTMVLTYKTKATAATGTGYIWERWENLTNATVEADEFEDTVNALHFTSGAATYNKGATGQLINVGAVRIEFGIVGLRISAGLSDESPVTFPATLWHRIKHCWVYIYPNATCRTLGSIETGATTLSGLTEAFEFAIEDTGSEIIYQYRPNRSAVWVTHFTSPLYTPSTLWHSDVVGYADELIFKGVKNYGGSI